jgi:hypothetical protein
MNNPILFYSPACSPRPNESGIACQATVEQTACQLASAYRLELRLSQDRLALSKGEIIHRHANPARAQLHDVWRQLAENVLTWNLDPVHFIHRMVTGLPIGSTLPLPSELMRSGAPAAYRAACDRMIEEKQQELEQQLQVVSLSAVSHGGIGHEADIQILATERRLLTLFRHCFGEQLITQYPDQRARILRLLADSRLEASLHYAFDAREYDQAWGNGWISADFRESALKTHREVYGL